MRIHLLAIGGTGMGTLAALLKDQGHTVTGSDTGLYPPMSDLLKEANISVLEGYDVQAVAALNPEVVVVGNSIHSDNPVAKWVETNKVPRLTMPQAIHQFAMAQEEGHKGLIVAGTHGKTTTTALSAYLLSASGRGANALVGGVVLGWNRSHLWSNATWTVVEGDEYETSYYEKTPKLWHYPADILILGNVEMDHRDNFQNLEAVRQAFRQALHRCRSRGGTLVYGGDDPEAAALGRGYEGKKVSFGLDEQNDCRAVDPFWNESGVHFSLRWLGQDRGEWTVPLWGFHNLRNSLGAIAGSLLAGADMGALAVAAKGFPGVKRRQEVVGHVNGHTIIDDFAHHPTALAGTLEALGQKYPTRPLVACFEPRSYTCQTKIHQNALPEALSSAHRIFLGPYPQGSHIPRNEQLDLEKIVSDLHHLGKPAKAVTSYDDLFQELTGLPKDHSVFIFFSSGSFNSLPLKLVQEPWPSRE